MKKRSLWIYGTAALAGSLTGGGSALWLTGAPRQVTVAHAPFQRSNAAHPPAVANTRPLSIIPLRAPHNNLTLAPAGSLSFNTRDTPVRSSKTSASPKTEATKQTASRQKPRKPLDLRLPASNTALASKPSSIKAQTHSTSTTDNPGPGVNFSPLTDSAPADANSTHLFNADDGLRGFMADNWVNQRLGFQGGLAIKEKRLREDNSDLRDNVAVGMGVLLAF